MPNRSSYLALVALSSLLIGACTRTVYVMRDPGLSPGALAERGGVTVSDEVLEISVDTESDYMLATGPEGGVVYLMVDLYGREIEPLMARPPMNVALVVDRSGSMVGPKLDAAKAAALSLLDELEDGDRVALLSYASDVAVELPSVPLSPRSRAQIERAVEDLRAAGGTDLGGGLTEGAREVLRGYDRGDLNRVILLSDGRPTIGDADPWRLETLSARWLEEGVSVTTMGIGVDYNEDLMTSLALAGGGNYYFVEHPYEMAQIFSRELRGLGATVARELEVALRLPPGARVSEVFGYRWEQRGDDVTVKLSGIAAGQRRRVLVALSVPASGGAPVTVGEGRLTYRDARGEASRSLELRPARISPTKDPRQVASAYHRAVVEKVEGVRNARLRERLVSRLDEGDEGGARALLRERLAAGRRAQRAVGGAALSDQVRALEELEVEVNAAPASEASPRYQRLRKREKARAFDALLY